MRIDNLNFEVQNNRASKDPRYVIEISFNNSFTDRQYFTSHYDCATPNGSFVLPESIAKNGISGTSQHIDPERGLATIGAIIVKLLDRSFSISNLLNTKLDIGLGLTGKRVRVYIGYEGFDWTDYVLIQTQIVDSVSTKNSIYSIKCADINRSVRQNIFTLKSTNLSTTIKANDLFIPVYDNTLFSAINHGASFSDAPNSTVFYVQIEDEIIRCSGYSTDPILGLVLNVDTINGRGVLDTLKADHVVDLSITDTERQTDVKEYCYLELPAPKLIYALLTGILLDLGSTLPNGWHLNIDPSYVRLSDFQNIGTDIYNTADDTQGVIAVFKGLRTTDGKAFIEKEINRLIGCFNPIYSTGEIGLKRMASVLAGASYVLELNEDNVISFGAVNHAFRETRNSYRIDWAYDDIDREYARTSLLIDPVSISVHGESKLKLIKLKGLDSRRHTSATLHSMFNFSRDRFTSPPIKIDIQCLPSLNVLEVGDIVRVNLNDTRDFNGSLAPLDRSFEVQNININWLTGEVTLKLFGSSSEAGELALGFDAQVLNDTFYGQTGSSLKRYLDSNFLGSYTESNNILTINSDVTFNGNDIATVYYYQGALTIGANATVKLTNTVDLRCRGHIQCDGKIVGKGLGHLGITATGVYSASLPIAGITGVMGNTWAGGGQTSYHTHPFGGQYPPSLYVKQNNRLKVFGQHTTLPYFNLVNNTISDVIDNIPTDLRGSSGGAGGDHDFQGSLLAVGGDGGAGGAGLITVSRGFSFGASGSIDLSGTDGGIGVKHPTDYRSFYSGSGAGGSGGGWLCLIDGSSNLRPDVSKIKTVHGSSITAGFNEWPTADPVDYQSRTEMRPYHKGYQGYPDTSAYYRIQFIHPSLKAVPDTSKRIVTPPTSLALYSGDTELLRSTDGTIISRIKAEWIASTDQLIAGYEVEYKKTSDLNFVPASNTINLEITSVFISPVQDGIDYDVRVRAINKYGVRSEWLVLGGFTVIGKLAEPPTVDNFLVTRGADGTRIFDGGLLTSNRPTDFAGYQIRAAVGSGLTWDQLQPLHSGLIVSLPWETNLLSAGHYVAAIRAVDTSGNLSVNAKYIETDLGDPRINNAITTVDFRANNFNGVLTNCWVDVISGNLIATDLNDWAGLPTTWAAWNQWAYTFNTAFTYESSVIDIGIDTNITPLVSVVSNGSTVIIEESHSSDNVTFTPFAVSGSQIKAQYIKIKITITNLSAIPQMTSAIAIFDADIVEEHIEDQNTILLSGNYRIGVGDIRLPLTKTFNQIKSVNITLQNVGAGWTWDLVDKNPTFGARIRLYDGNKNLADATIDAFIIGA